MFVKDFRSLKVLALASRHVSDVIRVASAVHSFQQWSFPELSHSQVSYVMFL